jgi:hypothetical protein
MSKQTRRRFSDEFKEEAVKHLAPNLMAPLMPMRKRNFNGCVKKTKHCAWSVKS